MFITKTIRGMILVKGKDDTYNPPTGQSSRWKHWMTEQDPKVCSACEAMQGKIYSLYEKADPAPPLLPGESGTRLTLTTMRVNETNTVSFGQMTA